MLVLLVAPYDFPRKLEISEKMPISSAEKHVGLISSVNIVISVTVESFLVILSRSGVLHVLTDEIAFVSPLNAKTDFDGIGFSDHFFLLVT